MNYQDYSSLISSGAILGIDQSVAIKAVGGECSAGGFLALPLSYTTPRYERNQVYEIKFADRPGDAGMCFLVTCSQQIYTYTTASSVLVAAYLADATTDDLAEIDSGAYRFKKDYIVLSPLLRSRYVSRFMQSSHIWGGFYHHGGVVPAPVPVKTGDILAFPDLELPTDLHKAEAFRANGDPSAIGRFLALYHLIELSFDYDLVQEIKSLPQNLKAVGKLLAEFDHGELPRLNRIIKKRWTDELSLSVALENLFSPSIYDDQLEDLLFGYGKDGFPWLFKDDQVKFQKFLSTARTSFRADKFSAAKLGWSVENLQKAICFVIYRFRCAIAHASIGECILSSGDDEFVESKAEPLIMAAISRIYKL